MSFDLEKPCSHCEGQGYREDEHGLCDRCEGFEKVLTEEGEELTDFLRRYGYVTTGKNKWG